MFFDILLPMPSTTPSPFQGRSRVLSAVLLLTALAACGESAPAEEVEPAWEVLEDGHPGGLLLSVGGHGPDDVWAVGGRPGETLVLRGSADADRLSRIAAPGTEPAWWVCALGDDATAIVGEGGMVLVDRGEGLTALDAGLSGTLYGCWGTGPDDFWIVGGDVLNGPAELTHIGADGPSAPDLGALVPQLPNVLYKVWGIDDHLWVVGDAGTVLSRDTDGGWELEKLDDAPIFTVHGRSATDVWAVGGRGLARAWRWDGAAWTADAPEDTPGLSGVCMPHADDDAVWATGAFGTLVRRRGGAWQAQEAGVADTLHAVWGDGGDRLWAVGGNLEDPNPASWRGVVVRR